MSLETTDVAIEQAFREEWGSVVATLIRRTGDWDLAEECAQDAFAEALRRWPVDGVPRRPGAWLTTVAGNRALDRVRRARRGIELLEQAGRDPTDLVTRVRTDKLSEMEPTPEEESGIEDDRLRLIFTCCHPALALEARVALTLRTLAGLTTAEVARAFLVPEATMAKRLTRAKAKIAGAGIPYRVPSANLLPERTGGVLAVLYLVFNEGYAATGGPELIRSALCEEAIRLGRLLTRLMPDEPEAAGLLALMLFQHSRRAARVGADGELVTLEDQDRSLWDPTQSAEPEAVLEAALRHRRPGPYQLQAAISACHAEAAAAGDTDWRQIAGLYELLLELVPSPVVRLNRAVAVAMADGLDPGLRLVEELAADGSLSDYHLLEATRADLLRRRGQSQAAAEAYRRALAAAPSEPERRFLTRRLQQVEHEQPPGGAAA
jgi:RNA polymerase sigma-70 factor (ECF subfamily)